MASERLKVCRCCHAVHTHEGWFALPLVGVQDLGDGERGEMRNCTCGSTICVELYEPGILLDLSRVFAADAAQEASEPERARLTGAARDLALRAGVALQTSAATKAA